MKIKTIKTKRYLEYKWYNKYLETQTVVPIRILERISMYDKFYDVKCECEKEEKLVLAKLHHKCISFICKFFNSFLYHTQILINVSQNVGKDFTISCFSCHIRNVTFFFMITYGS